MVRVCDCGVVCCVVLCGVCDCGVGGVCGGDSVVCMAVVVVCVWWW